VGNFNEFALVPPNGDSLLVITHVYSDATSRFGLATIAGFAAGSGAEGGVQFRDGRRTGKPTVGQFTKQPAAQIFAGAGGQAYQVLTANVLTAIPPFVLVGFPGGQGLAFIIESTVVNIAQKVQMYGYERPARKEEVFE